MRLFIAVNISENNHKKIAGIRTILKKAGADIKWVTDENIHITLKFLGDTGEEKLAGIKAKIETAIAGTKQFEICLDCCGFFPSEISPRIFFIGIKNGSKNLSGIAGKLDAELSEIGFSKETRPFAAHITIGRFRSGKGSEKLAKEAVKFPGETIRETVEKISLIKSTLTPAGPVYETVEEFCLEK